jgi:hypothetical protein
MIDPMASALVVGLTQAIIVPAILKMMKEDFNLFEVVAICALSGLAYLIPFQGATVSFLTAVVLLYWRNRPENVLIEVLLPVAIARLLSIPILIELST